MGVRSKQCISYLDFLISFKVQESKKNQLATAEDLHPPPNVAVQSECDPFVEANWPSLVADDRESSCFTSDRDGGQFTEQRRKGKNKKKAGETPPPSPSPVQQKLIKTALHRRAHPEITPLSLTEQELLWREPLRHWRGAETHPRPESVSTHGSTSLQFTRKQQVPPCSGFAYTGALSFATSAVTATWATSSWDKRLPCNH